MNTNCNEIKNIIFDFGGVILEIDYQRTVDAFINLGITNFDEIFSKIKQNNITDDFEEGKISGTEFLSYLKSISELPLKEDDILKAWNAIIIRFPLENLTILKQLKSQYRIYLLSNTNELHVTYFTQLINQSFPFEEFENCFDKIYYSHKIKYRKPKSEAFQKIIDENLLNPEETIFVDDLEKNLLPAKKLKMKTFKHSGSGNLKEFLIYLNS